MFGTSEVLTNESNAMSKIGKLLQTDAVIMDDVMFLKGKRHYKRQLINSLMRAQTTPNYSFEESQSLRDSINSSQVDPLKHQQKLIKRLRRLNETESILAVLAADSSHLKLHQELERIRKEKQAVNQMLSYQQSIGLGNSVKESVLLNETDSGYSSGLRQSHGRFAEYGTSAQWVNHGVPTPGVKWPSDAERKNAVDRAISVERDKASVRNIYGHSTEQTRISPNQNLNKATVTFNNGNNHAVIDPKQTVLRTQKDNSLPERTTAPSNKPSIDELKAVPSNRELMKQDKTHQAQIDAEFAIFDNQLTSPLAQPLLSPDFKAEPKSTDLNHQLKPNGVPASLTNGNHQKVDIKKNNDLFIDLDEPTQFKVPSYKDFTYFYTNSPTSSMLADNRSRPEVQTEPLSAVNERKTSVVIKDLRENGMLKTFSGSSRIVKVTETPRVQITPQPREIFGQKPVVKTFYLESRSLSQGQGRHSSFQVHFENDAKPRQTINPRSTQDLNHKFGAQRLNGRQNGAEYGYTNDYS